MTSYLIMATIVLYLVGSSRPVISRPLGESSSENEELTARTPVCDPRCEELEELQNSLGREIHDEGLGKGKKIQSNDVQEKAVAGMEDTSDDHQSAEGIFDDLEASYNDNEERGLECDARCQELRKVQIDWMKKHGPDNDVECDARCQLLKQLQHGFGQGGNVFGKRDTDSNEKSSMEGEKVEVKKEQDQGMGCDKRCQRLKQLQQSMLGGNVFGDAVADEKRVVGHHKDSEKRDAIYGGMECDERCQYLRKLHQGLIGSNNYYDQEESKKREDKTSQRVKRSPPCDAQCQYLKQLQQSLVFWSG